MVCGMPVIPELRKRSSAELPTETLSQSRKQTEACQGEADFPAIFLHWSQVMFITCWAHCQEETSFSVYNDVIRGHVLATFGLPLLISNFERPGVACPGLPSLPVRRHEQSRIQNNKNSGAL